MATLGKQGSQASVNFLKRAFSCIRQGILGVLLLLVRGYQLFLSPVLGSNCRFYPSCSHYCQDALREYGPGKGSTLTLKRILRCHPGNPGGFDPVPKKSS